MRSALVRRLLTVRSYVLAVVLTLGALLLPRLLHPAMPPLVLLFVIPILVASYFGGQWPGLFATVLAALGAAYFRLPPAGSFRIAQPDDRMQWFLLWAVGIGLSLAMGAVHRRRVRAETSQQRARNVLARQLQASVEQAKATRFQRFTRDAPIGIVLTDSEGRLLFANDEYLRIVGSSRDELESDSRREGRGALPEWLCAEGESRCEREIVRRDGVRVPVLIGLSRQPDGFAAFVLDLTAEKRVRQELEEANRRKSEFLGVLSHELRNPLAPIRNSVYILDHCDPMSDQGRYAKAVISRQVEHLTRLVDDLLDVTRIARGKIELRRETMSLNDLVRRSGEDHRAMLQGHRLAFSVTVPEEELWVEGDATRLSQIVGNLLQNAAKFSREGGRVELALIGGPGWADVRVKDEGVGFDPEMQEKLFEPFVQAERTLARSQGGLGLGLALVKGLAELHGGSARASSAGRGQGAVFTVRLPISAPGRPVEQPVGRTTPTPRRLRVLVVEDNREVAESLAQVVELLGHDVEVAHDGPGGLASARARPPDILLCDIGLPGMTGFEVARAFREDPELHGVRLVAVSGYAQPEDRKEASDAGFERHLAKPADPDEIERLLAT